MFSLRRCFAATMPGVASGRGWLLCFLAVAGLVSVALSGELKIDHIENFSANQVTIHFDTDPNLGYSLQALDSLSCGTNAPHCTSNGVPTQGWLNLFSVPPLPFPSHYVVADAKTNHHRFYRLLITP